MVRWPAYPGIELAGGWGGPGRGLFEERINRRAALPGGTSTRLTLLLCVI